RQLAPGLAGDHAAGAAARHAGKPRLLRAPAAAHDLRRQHRDGAAGRRRGRRPGRVPGRHPLVLPRRAPRWRGRGGVPGEEGGRGRARGGGDAVHRRGRPVHAARRRQRRRLRLRLRCGRRQGRAVAAARCRRHDPEYRRGRRIRRRHHRPACARRARGAMTQQGKKTHMHTPLRHEPGTPRKRGRIRSRALVRGCALALLAALPALGLHADDGDRPWLDTSKSFEERAAALVSEMTLEEKAAQMQNDSPAIERLGLPEYEWWNEALHGVARAGAATVFPQAIGMAATFDVPLMDQVSKTISDEARAKHHEAFRNGQHGRYQGLTFWSPNINIFRDPRWGRGQETYGEDPFLTARMGVSFVRGLQGVAPDGAPLPESQGGRYRKLDAT